MRHLFLTKRYLFFNLAVCCQQSPPNFSPPLCFFVTARLPRLPSLHRMESNGTVQPGLTSTKWTVPLWVDSRCVGRGGSQQREVSLASRSRNKSTVLRDNPPVSFSLHPSISISSRAKTPHQCDFDRNIPTVRVCVSVCAPPLDVCTRARKKKANNTAERQATNAAAVISCNTHTHTVFCPVFS